jgi:signal transduction histidine kinase
MRPVRPEGSQQRLPLVGGLFRRLLVHHLLLVTVPIAVLGFIQVNIAQNAIEWTLNQDNREFAERGREQIVDFSRALEEQFELLALQIGQLGLAQFPTDRYLNEAKSSGVASSFRHLYAVDTLNVIRATTDFGVSNILPPNGSLAFREARSRRETVFLPLTVLPEGEPPTVFAATPLYSQLEDFIGVLVAEVDVEAIWRVIENIQVGDRGFAFLTDHEGTVIAHRDKSIVYAGTNWRDLDSVRQALLGRTDLVENERISPETEPMLAAFTTVQTRLTGDRPWALVIHRPVAEVSATTITMRLQIVAVVVIGLALALVSTLVYTRRIIRPMGALVEGASRLSRGDLAQKIPVVGRDEMGTRATEFNLMVEQLSRIQERLRRAEHLDTLSKFSSVVSHEIRNPLNAMQINLHLLRERVGEEEQGYLNVISGEIKRLENLVREFQNISRPPVLSTEPTDVNTLIVDIVNLQRSTAENQGVRLHLRLDERLPAVQVDRNRITQVLLNLVLNALQAMPEGGELTIHSRPWGEPPGGVVVQVSDTGEGIGRVALTRVFDYYFTTRDSGSGLGLSIAQRIVEEHGGRITIASEPGQGTTLTVALPPRPPDH